WLSDERARYRESPGARYRRITAAADAMAGWTDDRRQGAGSARRRARAGVARALGGRRARRCALERVPHPGSTSRERIGAQDRDGRYRDASPSIGPAPTAVRDARGDRRVVSRRSGGSAARATRVEDGRAV